MITAAQARRGYVRPLRHVYTHSRCKKSSCLSDTAADILARHPGFFAGFHCVACRGVFKASEFVWADTTEKLSEWLD